MGAIVDIVTHTRACSAYIPRARTEMATASQGDDGDDDDDDGGGGAKMKRNHLAIMPRLGIYKPYQFSCSIRGPARPSHFHV